MVNTMHKTSRIFPDKVRRLYKVIPLRITVPDLPETEKESHPQKQKQPRPGDFEIKENTREA